METVVFNTVSKDRALLPILSLSLSFYYCFLSLSPSLCLFSSLVPALANGYGLELASSSPSADIFLGRLRSSASTQAINSAFLLSASRKSVPPSNSPGWSVPSPCAHPVLGTDWGTCCGKKETRQNAWKLRSEKGIDSRTKYELK